jgi:diguanylate cyclase (GGDEF)-like protein
MFLFPEENSYKYIFTANYALIPSGLFVLTGLRFKNVLKVALFLTLIIYIVVITQFGTLNTAYYIFLFTSITVISIVGAYFTELYRRKFFLKEKYTETLLEELETVNNKLHHISVTDELTQINNRRSFNEIINREISSAREDEKYIAFIMVDIDFFKLYNDHYGHLAGDETLKKVAQSLEKSFQKSTDFVFRLGGEEFGILLSDCDKKSCEQSVKNMHRNIKELKIEHEESSVHEYVTISSGLIYTKVDEKIDANHLIKKADEALYKAKNLGRDRYVFV